MSLVDDLVTKYGVTLDELREDNGELATFYKQLAAAEGKHITIDSFKTFLQELKTHCEEKLAITPETEFYFFGLLSRPNREHVQLKARLLNYIVLESFLTTPEKARKYLEYSMERIADLKKESSV